MEKIKSLLTKHWKRVVAFSLVLILLLGSVTFLGKAFSDPNTYRDTIASIDEKKLTVLGVSAAIAGWATLLAAVPDDATTPLSEELMDLASYLMLVVCVLVLEKSLLTVFGAVACYVLLPIACVFAMIFIVNKKKFFINWAIKIGVLALAFLIIVPASMTLSDYIYDVNNLEVEQLEDAPETIEPESEEEEDLPWYSKLWNDIKDTVKSVANAAVEKGKQLINDFTDAVSVFVIAYCAIPVFVVFLLLWLLKFLFGINFDIKTDSGKTEQKKDTQKGGSELTTG